MPPRPRLSIVLAVHDAEGELRVFLESLSASRFKDFELCVCDDASADGAAGVLRSYEGRLPVRAVRNETNRGVTFSRNRAVELAKAPLLLFMDADIRLYPDTVGKLVGLMERTGADVVEGVYTDVALDDDAFSRYYALFVHHSFLISDEPVPYNVFNAWCALCRREVMEKTGGHGVVEKGIEIENETLGRRIVANGFKLLLDPSIAVDHHWGGHRKLVFIFTKRIYWWVKIFFATGCRFESSLTTPSYGLATLCLPAAAAAAIPGWFDPLFWPLIAALLAGFLYGYGPFFAFARRRRGAAYLLLAVPLAMYFSFFAAASAALSAYEEVLRRVLLGRTTLDPETFRG